MNRQTNFIYDKSIFLFGGFDSKNQQKPLGTLFGISLEKLFEKNIIYKNGNVKGKSSKEIFYINNYFFLYLRQYLFLLF